MAELFPSGLEPGGGQGSAGSSGGLMSMFGITKMGFDLFNKMGFDLFNSDNSQAKAKAAGETIGHIASYYTRVPGLSYVGGKVGESVSSPGGHPHVSPKLSSEEFDNIVMQSFRLDWPEWSYKGNHKFEDFFSDKQRHIDKAFDITLKSLEEIGPDGRKLSKELQKVWREIEKETRKGAQEERHASQQGYINALGVVWNDVDSLFDIAEKQGTDGNVRNEFYRQVQETVFNSQAKQINKILREEYGKGIRGRHGKIEGYRTPSEILSEHGMGISGERNKSIYKDLFSGEISSEPTGKTKKRMEKYIKNNLDLFTESTSSSGRDKLRRKQANASALNSIKSSSLREAFKIYNPTVTVGERIQTGTRRTRDGRVPVYGQSGDEINISYNPDQRRLAESRYGKDLFPASEKAINISTPIADISTFPPANVGGSEIEDLPPGEGGGLDFNIPTGNVIPGTDIPGSVDGSGGNEQPESDDLDFDIPLTYLEKYLNLPDSANVDGRLSLPRLPQIDLSVPFPEGGSGVGGSLVPVSAIPISGSRVIDPRRNLRPPEVHKYTPRGFPLVSSGILQPIQ